MTDARHTDPIWYVIAEDALGEAKQMHSAERQAFMEGAVAALEKANDFGLLQPEPAEVSAL